MNDPAEDVSILVSQGWEYRFTASEPSLSVHVSEYESLGFEVKLVVVPTDESSVGCASCIAGSAPIFSIWIRKSSG